MAIRKPKSAVRKSVKKKVTAAKRTLGKMARRARVGKAKRTIKRAIKRRAR